MQRIITALILLGLPIVATARDTNGDGMETILLPLAFLPGSTVNGNNGTQWSGEVWLHNANPTTVELETQMPCIFNECTAPYRAGYTGRVLQPLPATPEGGVVFLTRADAADGLTLSNRVFETTRNAQPLGVQMPVVREHQFLRGTSRLLGLPGGTTARVALRIFDPHVESPFRSPVLTVLVEVVTQTGPSGAEEETVVGNVLLSTAPATPSSARRPGFAATYDLAGAIPVIKTLPRFSLRITAQTNDEYWAMASITDNATQEFVLVTPQ